MGWFTSATLLGGMEVGEAADYAFTGTIHGEAEDSTEEDPRAEVEAEGVAQACVALSQEASRGKEAAVPCLAASLKGNRWLLASTSRAQATATPGGAQ